MKKSLMLLALSLHLFSEKGYSIPQERVEGADIEILAPDIPYEHPKSKDIGDRMPFEIGRIIYFIDMYLRNKRTGAMRPGGIITGYDLDGDKTAEYEFLRRDCDIEKGNKVYAVLDVPHKLFYIDSTRNNHIDLIVEGIETLGGKTLPMIPVKCLENEIRT